MRRVYMGWEQQKCVWKSRVGIGDSVDRVEYSKTAIEKTRPKLDRLFLWWAIEDLNLSPPQRQ